jgi:hypothetical protein
VRNPWNDNLTDRRSAAEIIPSGILGSPKWNTFGQMVCGSEGHLRDPSCRRDGNPDYVVISNGVRNPWNDSLTDRRSVGEVVSPGIPESQERQPYGQMVCGSEGHIRDPSCRRDDNPDYVVISNGVRNPWNDNLTDRRSAAEMIRSGIPSVVGMTTPSRCRRKRCAP